MRSQTLSEGLRSRSVGLAGPYETESLSDHYTYQQEPRQATIDMHSLMTSYQSLSKRCHC